MLQPSLIDQGRGQQWVSVSEAARLEGSAGRPVNKSSISRFIDRNPDVPVKRDARGRVEEVEYLALSEARTSSLSVQDSRALTAPAAPATVTPIAAPAGSRKRALEEEKLELDLAERKGELLDRAAVTMAWEAVGVVFTQGLERRRRKIATELVGLTDIRQAELALKAADRQLLEQLVKDLGALAGEMTADEPEQAAA